MSLVIVTLLLPLVGAFLVAITGKSPNLREGMTAIASVATLGCVVALVPDVWNGVPVEYVGVEILPGVPIALKLEPLGMLYALVAAGLWPITSLYAVGYMRGHHESNQTRFFVCFALAIFAALGIAFSANLGTLFLFYEVLTLSTYPLVTHNQNDEAKRAGRIYLGILISTSIGLLLLAIAWTYHATGTLDFRAGGILEGHVPDAVLPILLGLYAYGCGKAALMPLHRWLPNAMVAPTPVSALLHAVAVVKAGVFSILKIVVYIFGLDLLQSTDASDWLVYVAAFTLVTGSLIAFTKDNLKARLAYSTIAQLAYIVLGAALANRDGVLGAGLHIATHAVGKITLFFCAGAIMVAAHKKNISEMDGLGRRMPFTMGAFFIASLSIIGLPPLGGSWSKWLLALGAADEHAVIIAVLMVSSLLNIGYLIPIPIRAFFFPEKAHTAGHAHDDAGHQADEAHTTSSKHNEHEHSERDGEQDEHSERDGEQDEHSERDGEHDEHGHDAHGHDAHDTHDHGEAPLACVIPLCITAVGCVVLFFWAQQIVYLLLPLVSR